MNTSKVWNTPKKPKRYYYYTKWYYGGDENVSAGIYHTGTISALSFSEFCEDISSDTLLVERFETLEELNKKMLSVSLIELKDNDDN